MKVRDKRRKVVEVKGKVIGQTFGLDGIAGHGRSQKSWDSLVAEKGQRKNLLLPTFDTTRFLVHLNIYLHTYIIKLINLLIYI